MLRVVVRSTKFSVLSFQLSEMDKLFCAPASLRYINISVENQTFVVNFKLLTPWNRIHVLYHYYLSCCAISGASGQVSRPNKVKS